MARNESNIVADVNFLFEMGNIRFINRMWQRFLAKDFANLAEHHFRVFWIAMVLAGRENGNIDTGRVAKLAMIHDIAESRTGDVDYLSRQYVQRNEELGIRDMLADTSLQKEFYELWQEYETRESIESKIVKDADNLDVDMELAEQAAQGRGPLRDAKTAMRKKDVRARLYTESARQMFDHIVTANPHDWHLLGRNRHSHGDWHGKAK